MSTKASYAMSSRKAPHEHGTMRAYIIGFILSLIFTFIPYFLVVNHTITGMALLVTILGFGVLQMLVQVLFFLHLGRGPKPTYEQVFFVVTVFTILVVVGGSIIITSNLRHHMAPSASEQTKKLVNDEAIYQIGGEKTGACQGQHDNHQVMIMDNKVTPFHIEAKRCDTLTFMNHDAQAKEIVFGEYPEHKSYAGETEYVVRSGHNKTITLSEVGTYTFHDHVRPETVGEFTVE